ncbi:hypothetical protein ACQEVZ_60550 [Dactylosporangium sp. CA-152071]|uniref:hypothetical protein n=1 Tax=Dactylosporangium sp. CA-152071 TaxID=3239933 RepID=UPI003D8E77DE
MRPEDRLVRYGSKATPSGEIRLILGADLLDDDVLLEYLRSLPARVLERVVVDASVVEESMVETRPPVEELVAAAARLGVPVETLWFGEAPQDVDWDRLELLNREGVPAGMPFARTVRALPPGVQARPPAAGLSGPRLWPETFNVSAGAYLPPGDDSGLETAETRHLAELYPVVVGMFVVFVHGHGAAIVWKEEVYDAGRFVAAIPRIAAARGMPLRSSQHRNTLFAFDALMVVNLSPPEYSLDEGFGRQVSQSLGRQVVLVEGLTPIPLSDSGAEPEQFTTANGSPARSFRPDGSPPQPLAPALHDTLRLLFAFSRPGVPLNDLEFPELLRTLHITWGSTQAAHVRRWIDMIGRVPGNLPELATMFAVSQMDLFNLSQSLAVHPRAFRLVAGLLPAALADGHKLAWSRLQVALHDAGVHNGLDLVLLLELADRHVLNPADLPVLRSLARRGLPVELLHYLPFEAVHRMLVRERRRVTAPASAAELVTQWDLRHESALRTLAFRLQVTVEDLPGLYGELLDKVVKRLLKEGQGVKLPGRDEPAWHSPYSTLVDGWVTKLVAEVERSLRTEWGVSANTLAWAMGASGQLGFPVTELAGVPSTRLWDMLVAQTLMRGGARATVSMLAMVASSGEADLPPNMPEPVGVLTRDPHRAPDYTPSGRVAQPSGSAAPPYQERDVREVDRLGRRLHLSPQDLARLVRLTATIGRAPTDLAALAHRMDIPAQLLLEVAEGLGVEPRHLWPFRKLLRRADSEGRRGLPVRWIVVTLERLATNALGPVHDPSADAPQMISTFLWLVTAAQLDADQELTFLRRLHRFSSLMRRAHLRDEPLDVVLSHSGRTEDASFDDGRGDVELSLSGQTEDASFDDRWGAVDEVLVGDTAPYGKLLLDYWAARLKVDRADVTTFVEKYPGSSLDVLIQLAEGKRIKGAALLRYATAIGRVPVELASFAGSPLVKIGEVVSVGTALEVDPHLTTPVVLQANQQLDAPPQSERLDTLKTVLVPELGLDPALILSVMYDFRWFFSTRRLPQATDLAEWRAIAWGVSPAVVADYGSRLNRLQHTALTQLVSELVASLYPDEALQDQPAWTRLFGQIHMSRTLLEMYILRIGRVPTDLSTVAARLRVDHPSRLLALAARLNVDVRVLRDSDGVARLNRRGHRKHLLSGVEDLAQEIERREDWSERDRPERNMLDDLLWLAAHTGRVPADLLNLADSANRDLSVTLLLAVARDLKVDPRLVAALVRERTSGVVNATAPPRLSRLADERRRGTERDTAMTDVLRAATGEPQDGVSLRQAIVDRYRGWADALFRDHRLPESDIWSFFTWLDGDRERASTYPSQATVLVQQWFNHALMNLSPVISWLSDARQWHGLLLSAAGRLGVSAERLTVLSLRVGRALTDVAELARRAGVEDPVRLLALAHLLGVDPAVLAEQEWIRRLNTSPAEEVAGWVRQDPVRRRRLPSAPSVSLLIMVTGRLVLKHAVDPSEVVAVLRRLVESGLDPLSVTDARFVAVVQAERAAAWAPSFDASAEEIADDFTSRPWLSHTDVVSAADDAGVARRDMLILARRVGKQPTSVRHLAEQWGRGVSSASLFELAASFGIDPVHLWPLIAGPVNDSQPLAETIRRRRETLDTLSAESGYDAATLLLAMNDQLVWIDFVASAAHARSIVEAWLAFTAGLDVPTYQNLAREPWFDLDRIRAAVKYFADLWRVGAIGRPTSTWMESELHANGSIVLLENVTRGLTFVNQGPRAGRLSTTIAERGPYRLMLALLPKMDLGLSGHDAAELYEQSVAGGYALDTLTPDVLAAYEAVWKVHRDRRGAVTKPVVEALLGRFGRPWPLPGERQPTVVYGGRRTLEPAASGDLRLYQHLLGVPADWQAIQAAYAGPLRAVRDLDRRRAGTPATEDAEDAEALVDLAGLGEEYEKSGSGWGRFLSADGARAAGLSGIVEHIAGTARGRGIVLLRSPGGAAPPSERLLNVFGGDAGEVVFIDPLTGGPADLSGTAALDVFFLATESGVTAPFELASPQAEAVPNRPRRNVSDLGLHPVEVGPFLAALTGPVPVGAAAADVVRRWRIGWWSDMFGVAPEEIEVDLRERPWLQYSEMLALARTTGTAPELIRQLSMTIERVPADLPGLARRIGSTSRQLWALSSTLDADPLHVASILGAGADYDAVTRLEIQLIRVGQQVGDSAATLVAVLTDEGLNARDLEDIGDDLLVERYNAWLQNTLDVAPQQAKDLIHASHTVHSSLRLAAAAVAGSVHDIVRAAQDAGASWQRATVQRLQAHPIIRQDLGPATGTDRMDIDDAGMVGRFLVDLVEFVQRHALRPHEIGPVVSELAGTAQTADEVVRNFRTTGEALLLPADANEVDAGPLDLAAERGVVTEEPAGPEPRRLMLPEGVTEVEGVLVVGASPDPERPLWGVVGGHAEGLGRPVVVESPEDPATLIAVGRVLERLRWNGEQAIVVLGGGASPAPDLLRLLAGHEVALVHQAPPAAMSGAVPQLTNVWAVTDPDGVTVRHDGAELTAAVLDAAARTPRPAGDLPPAVFVDWLTAGPERSGAVLLKQSAELDSVEVRRWLQAMTARAATGDQTGPMHIALLDLAALGHAAWGLAYRAAPDPRQRAATAFGADPARLRNAADPLARLASATAVDEIDRANAAILAAIDIVLVQEPDLGEHDLSAIVCLPGDDRLEWYARLTQLHGVLGSDVRRHEALGELILLTLSCKEVAS